LQRDVDLAHRKFFDHRLAAEFIGTSRGVAMI